MVRRPEGGDLESEGAAESLPGDTGKSQAEASAARKQATRLSCDLSGGGEPEAGRQTPDHRHASPREGLS